MPRCVSRNRCILDSHGSRKKRGSLRPCCRHAPLAGRLKRVVDVLSREVGGPQPGRGSALPARTASVLRTEEDREGSARVKGFLAKVLRATGGLESTALTPWSAEGIVK